MKYQDCLFTPARRRRFETQGYNRFTDSELNDFKFGIRFAYYLCGSPMLLGLLLTNLKILTVVMIIAFLGTLPPYQIAGGTIVSIAILVSTMDLCIPSIIYNFIFKIKVE